MSKQGEIVANIIEEFGQELCCDPIALAIILDAISAEIVVIDEPQEPDYDSYEDSHNGEIGAEADFASDMIWSSLRNQLKTLAHELRHDATYHI